MQTIQNKKPFQDDERSAIYDDCSPGECEADAHSSTLKTENFQQFLEADNDTSLVVNHNHKDAKGLSLVLSNHSKVDRNCKRDSSTMEMEESTIFFESDTEASLDTDYDTGLSFVLASSLKDDRSCDFETSSTMLPNIDREELNRSLREPRKLPSFDKISDDGTESVESDRQRELERFSKIMLNDDTERQELLELPSCRMMDEDDIAREESLIEDDTEIETSDLPRKLPNYRSRKKVATKYTSSLDLIYGLGEASSGLPSCQTMDGDQVEREESYQSHDLPNCKSLIEDDTESEHSDMSREPSNFRCRKKHATTKYKSSLDLIYGHDEATPYFSHGPLGACSDRCSSFGISSGDQQNINSRISKNPVEMKALRLEAFFYNRGMEIAMGVLYLALNYLVAAHGAYQFTEAGGWTTDDDILRITLPIARAGGRLVTLNCAVLLLTACKYLWTLVRTYVAPVIPIGFPIDDVMPKYHRYVALTVIVSGCIIHTLPQMVNYATKSISIDHNGIKIWTFGDGYATKQLLLTGTLLTIIFSTFFLTTLKAFRKTAAGFRWFWFFHVGGIATAYPLLLMHGTCKGHPVFFYVALLPLMLYIFDICMRRYNIMTANIIRWETHEDQGQEITELVVECPPNFEYTPGQYAEIKFLPISEREWHPFTIASAPNEKPSGKDGKKEIVFFIKNLGRWTEALFEYASAYDLSKAKKCPQISIRGPHGAPAMNYFAYKHILVIGSGVGVAPLVSIWKYLVAKGKDMADDKKGKLRSLVRKSMHQSVMDASHNVLLSNRTPDLEGDDDDIAFGESLEIAAAKSHSTIRADCIFLQTILESMAISLSLFALFVLGETLTIVLQLFGCVSVANTLGYSLSIFALIVHGTTIIVSSIAMGWCVYSKHFRCWLEFSIVILDSIALWFSLRSNLEDPEEEQQDGRENIISYLTIFSYVVVLHAIRIFHIFYVALKPTPTSTADKTKKADISIQSNSRGSKMEEICSVEGILINRKYSSMRFAAKDLLPPIVEEDLSDLYSMEFYGTRETETKEDEKDLISDMMGGKENPDTKSSLLLLPNNNNNNKKKYFCPGRPDWNRIFLKAIARAHCTSDGGESVGIFFCGSPAIAKDLQAEAKRVTAQHQFAMKHLDGKPCRCKLIVHSECF